MKELIESFIQKNKEKTVSVAVIGDIMIDEYYNVNVNRISQEFPVQVMKSETDRPFKTLLGGAGNAYSQMKNFNVNCKLYGFVDGETAEWQNEFNIFNTTTTIWASIPRKKRFYDNQYPLMRWDVENEYCNILDKEYQTLWNTIDAGIKKDRPNIVILSDYNKGVFRNGLSSKIIALCNELNIPTIVDPKQPPFEPWKNCTIFKPNLAEATVFTNTNFYSKQSQIISNQLNCKSVVITQGGKGVSTFCNDKETHFKLNININEQSVVGAGDAFCGTYAIAYAHGFSFEESSQIAYCAGAIYVQDKHNKPIFPHELKKIYDTTSYKIQDENTLKNIIDSLENKRIILTNGCMDILHLGHIKLLEYAKKQGDILIVAVDSDENVKRLKGEKRPINTLKDRMELLSSLHMVDFVVAFDGSPAHLIKKLGKVDILVKGGDYLADNVLGREFVKEVKIFPLVENKSSTKIIEHE